MFVCLGVFWNACIPTSAAACFQDVRLGAACCLVDVLRVYAPDAPYGEGELRAIFDLLIKQVIHPKDLILEE